MTEGACFPLGFAVPLDEALGSQPRAELWSRPPGCKTDSEEQIALAYMFTVSIAGRLTFVFISDMQILCPQDARSAFPGYGPRLSNVHPSMYRAAPPGLSRPELYGNGMIPNPANVHMARTAQLSAFPQVCSTYPWTNTLHQSAESLMVFSWQRGVLWEEELRNIGPVAFPSDACTSSLENSGKSHASLCSICSLVVFESSELIHFSCCRLNETGVASQQLTVYNVPCCVDLLWLSEFNSCRWGMNSEECVCVRVTFVQFD
jgi:hypothetical protein